MRVTAFRKTVALLMEKAASLNSRRSSIGDLTLPSMATKPTSAARPVKMYGVTPLHDWIPPADNPIISSAKPTA